MRTTLRFYAVGIPMAQPRARACARGKFARVYNPSGKHDDWKSIVRDMAWMAWQSSDNKEPWTGPLIVSLSFYFPRPKSHYRANGQLKPNAPKWHTSKPDRDNADKLILDALTNVGIWQDDKQVCDGSISKRYIDENHNMPGCLVEISEATI